MLIYIYEKSMELVKSSWQHIYTYKQV